MRWEDGSTAPERMFAVWPASYVNYVPTNDLVIVPRFWKPGRSIEVKRRDDEARDVLTALFPGREIVQVYAENVIRGGGGMNCITQQQPASARFAEQCGWAKVKVDVQTAVLYQRPTGANRWASCRGCLASGTTSISNGCRSTAACSSVSPDLTQLGVRS